MLKDNNKIYHIMNYFKELLFVLLFFVSLTSCKEEENTVVLTSQSVEEVSATNSSAVIEEVPTVDPSTIIEKAPIDLNKMNGTWKANFVWTPGTGWQKLVNGPSADFYYGTFLYYRDIWTIDFSEISLKNSSVNALFGPYSLYYINTLELGIFYEDIAMQYAVQAYQDNNALLVKSLYEGASEPNEYYWFVKQ